MWNVYKLIDDYVVLKELRFWFGFVLVCDKKKCIIEVYNLEELIFKKIKCFIFNEVELVLIMLIKLLVYGFFYNFFIVILGFENEFIY